ncbi:hypothetical protein C0Z17_07515 [Trinickia caryophylli]|nr:hypothetical protein C0Z17_07515 [Trinickia caryophylli]
MSIAPSASTPETAALPALPAPEERRRRTTGAALSALATNGAAGRNSSAQTGAAGSVPPRTAMSLLRRTRSAPNLSQARSEPHTPAARAPSAGASRTSTAAVFAEMLHGANDIERKTRSFIDKLKALPALRLGTSKTGEVPGDAHPKPADAAHNYHATMADQATQDAIRRELGEIDKLIAQLMRMLAKLTGDHLSALTRN